jgi:hypothetical protein
MALSMPVLPLDYEVTNLTSSAIRRRYQIEVYRRFI